MAEIYTFSTGIDGAQIVLSELESSLCPSSAHSLAGGVGSASEPHESGVPHDIIFASRYAAFCEGSLSALYSGASAGTGGVFVHWTGSGAGERFLARFDRRVVRRKAFFFIADGRYLRRAATDTYILRLFLFFIQASRRWPSHTPTPSCHTCGHCGS